MTKILHKMLLISLMTCSGAIMRPAGGNDQTPASASLSAVDRDVPTLKNIIMGKILDGTYPVTTDELNQLPTDLQHDIIETLITTSGNVQNAFFYAAQNGLAWALAPLLTKGAEIEAIEPPRTIEGADVTALDLAAEHNHEAIVRFLIAQGADVNGSPVQSLESSSPLNWAVIHQNDELAMFLIENGANLTTLHNNQYTALYLATEMGNENIIKLLIRHRADISVPDDNGETALHLAARTGNITILKILIEEGGADINATADIEALQEWNEDNDFERPTVLHSAARACHAEMIKFLLEKEANITATDHHGRTSLQVIGTDYTPLDDQTPKHQIKLCAEILINGYRTQLARQCATNEPPYHGNLGILEKMTAFIQPALQDARANNDQEMIAFLEEKLTQNYALTASAETENQHTTKRKTEDDDDLPQAKRPRFTADDEAAAPAQLGLDAPCGTRPQPMDTGCAVAQERNRERMQAARATRFEAIKTCDNCQGIDYPLELTHLLTCCYRTICQNHFTRIAGSDDLTCPYLDCNKPHEQMRNNATAFNAAIARFLAEDTPAHTEAAQAAPAARVIEAAQVVPAAQVVHVDETTETAPEPMEQIAPAAYADEAAPETRQTQETDPMEVMRQARIKAFEKKNN